MTRRYTGGFLSSKEQVTDVNSANGIYTTQEAGALTTAGTFPTGRWTPQRSLRIRSSASAYLSRTPASASNRQIMTFSMWVKLGATTGGTGYLFSANTASGYNDGFGISFGSGTLDISATSGSATILDLNTTQVFRDPSAWYHIFYAIDTTQATASNRIKLYVNGSQVTAFGTATYPSQNTSFQMNNTVPTYIGRLGYTSSAWYDGYLTEINFIDGQALDPTYFGATDPETGTWVPKQYTGTYGTNGFYLPFRDNTTTGALGFNYANTGNKVTYSEQFDNAAWIKSGVTVTANATTAPDSTTTADKIIPSTTPGVDHIIYQSPTIAGGVYTLSVYAKAAGYNFIALRGDDTTVAHIQTFDLANGVVNRLEGQYTNAITSATMTPAGNGWYRCSITFTATGGMQNAVYYPLPVQNNNLYAGDGTSGVFVWGAQLNTGTAAETYQVTTASVINNDWTPNNISVTAGATYDSMVDVPGIAAVSGQTDIGGIQRGNYCTLNPLHMDSSNNAYRGIADANLRLYNTFASSGVGSASGTLAASSGKFYWEFVAISNAGNGTTYASLYDTAARGAVAAVSGTVLLYTGNGEAYPNYGTYGVAVDIDKGYVWYKNYNGTWIGGGNPATGTLPTGTFKPNTEVTPLAYNFRTSGYNDGGYSSWNFGQQLFTYTPPTGYKSLNTTNLPNPIIKRSSDHFDVKLYSGGGGYLNVGNVPKQGTNYQIGNSLRFKGSTAPRSPLLWRNYSTSGTGGSQKWTYSVWVKKGFMSNEKGTLLWGGQGGGSGSVTITDSNNTGFMFETNGTLAFEGQNTQWFTTTALFNDKTNWHHLVLACDTTQVSGGERIKLYVDGVRIDRFSTFNALTQNQNTGFGQATCYHQIGARYNQQDNPFDGFMAEANFVDGQQLAPTAFGQFDASNNWVPTRYSGTYGTNGWYLPFTQPSLSNAGTSTYAASFDGSTQYLTTPANAALTLSTTPFTVEFWMNIKATTGNVPIVSQDYTTGLDIRVDESGSNRLGFYLNNSSFVYGFYPAVWRDTWQHVAVVRNASNVVTMYVNGFPICSTTNSGNLTANTFRIGQLVSGGATGLFNGSISNVRVVKGTAVYTSQFTPPTGPLTAISGTVLLALTTATVTADASTNNFTLTNSGSVTADVSYPMAKSVGVDASGNGNDLTQSYTIDTPAPSVLTYGAPGTYTWVAPSGVTSVKALVIAGGGGGADNGGGGGAGGMIYNAAYSVTPGNSYTVTVGSGGRGGSNSSNLPQNGRNSVFATLTAVGGGSGSQQGVVAAGNGGSGGGGSYNYTTGGTATSGQGNAGGTGSYGNGGNTYYGAGGGGAGGVGYNGGDSRGGPGLANSITGSLKYYAGGGGGNYFITNNPTWAVGGIGGGGSSNTGVYTMGQANTGGGGGTRGGNNGYWSTGGSGVVILSYTNANTYTGAGSNLLDIHDMATDSPTEYDASTDGNDIGGLVRGSYTKFNNSIKLYPSSPTITNGGLTMYSNAGDYQWAITDMPITNGKWYWEYTVQGNGSSGCYHGIMDAADFPYMTTNNQVPSSVAAAPRGFSLNPGGQGGGNYGVAYGGSSYNPSPGLYWESGDVIQWAFDADKKLVSVGKNGTWVQSQVPTTGANAFPIVGSGTYYPFAGSYDHPSLGTYGVTANFGQKPFVYTPPTGFKSINSKNLKDVGSYNLPNTFGNAVNTPDLVWTKSRSGPSAISPRLYDTVRGAGYSLGTNSQGASGAETNQGLSAFTPNGFTLTSPNGAAPYCLEDRTNYVAWMWNRGVTPGFDIVNYAGGFAGAGAGDVKHGLGQVPAMIIIKNTSATSDWAVWHKGYGSGTSYQTLNTTIVPTSNSAWFGSAPTSSTFNVGNALATGNGGSFVAYLWAEVPGFSKFSTYTGNGSTDGPFIYTGFKPKWIMIKRTDSVSGADWQIQDGVRNILNPTGGTALAANDNRSENTFAFSCDILSNGFKIRATDTGCNASGGGYIYAAFAESPFKYANAR